MTELKLIEKCIGKEPIAQKALFENYYKQMYNLGMRFLANHHDTEDLLIIAFTKVFDKIADFEFRGENSLKKWVKTIVINEAIRFLEQRKALQLVEDYLFVDKELHMDGEISLDTEEAYTIIENMPAGYRMIFNLFAIEGYSHLEISEMLSITQSTSKSQLCKARNYIINRLEKTSQYGIEKYR